MVVISESVDACNIKWVPSERTVTCIQSEYCVIQIVCCRLVTKIILLIITMACVIYIYIYIINNNRELASFWKRIYSKIKPYPYVPLCKLFLHGIKIGTYMKVFTCYDLQGANAFVKSSTKYSNTGTTVVPIKYEHSYTLRIVYRYHVL